MDFGLWKHNAQTCDRKFMFVILYLLGPLCNFPPNPPFEGTLENIPIIFPKEAEEACDIDGNRVDIKCPSFLNIYITSGYYGRLKGSTVLCNGNKDSVSITEDCLNLQVQVQPYDPHPPAPPSFFI